jgi:hypothetical protein
MGEAKRRRERGEEIPHSRIPEGFVKGLGENYFGVSDPPEPVRATIAVAAAQGRPFVPAGTMYTVRDDAEGPPVVLLLRRGCDYGKEIEGAAIIAKGMNADLYLTFDNADDFHKLSRMRAAHYGH